MKHPVFFVDEMVAGHFRSFRHEHRFEISNGKTEMFDLIEYETPFGPLGWLFDVLALKRHLTELIALRNTSLKEIAEHASAKSQDFPGA